jgi:hypothetical protein
MKEGECLFVGGNQRIPGGALPGNSAKGNHRYEYEGYQKEASGLWIGPQTRRRPHSGTTVELEPRGGQTVGGKHATFTDGEISGGPHKDKISQYIVLYFL